MYTINANNNAKAHPLLIFVENIHLIQLYSGLLLNIIILLLIGGQKYIVMHSMT